MKMRQIPFQPYWTVFFLLALNLTLTPLKAAEHEEMLIVTSFYPIYIATVNVAGGIPDVAVKNLTKPFTGCLHDYQMTPAEMVELSRAAVFIVNGGGMESFLDKVVKQLPKLKILEASAGIEFIKNNADGEPNAHVWVSPTLAQKQVATIAAKLAELDPGNAAAYQRNAAAYSTKLEALRTKMHEALQSLPVRQIITFHEAFPYFAREFDLEIVAVIEREPGSEPSARELAATIETVRKTKVKALFAEPQYPAKCADTIARETGATVYTLDPGVSGPLTPNAYLTIMEKNLLELCRALKPPKAEIPAKTR